MSSSTRSGGFRAMLARALSPLSATPSLYSPRSASTRMSTLDFESSTMRTRLSPRSFMDGSVTEGNHRFNRTGMSVLADGGFERLRRLGHRLAGLELRERHRTLLERRLRRLGADEKLLASWLDAADEGEPAAVQRIIGLLTTKHTGFFRHPLQFDL